jgi:hypothetical protein
MNSDPMLSENLQAVRRKIRAACARAARDPSDVTLIAVTKTFSVDSITAAMQLGLKIFGESYIQEAFLKAAALPAIIPPEISREDVSWHLIGHLQKNKAAQAVKLFDVIHSVDSAALADAINRHAGNILKIQRVLVQVSLAGEDTKYGIDEAGLIGLVKAISGMPHLKLEGLMTIPPYNDDPEALRPYFARLRRLRDEINADGFALRELSMGMSGDFEAAVEEGSTMVRVGTGLFGSR